METTADLADGSVEDLELFRAAEPAPEVVDDLRCAFALRKSWNFTVLGEAVAQLSEATKAAHPHVGWSDPVRVRNRIVHGYWSVDLDVLVAAARDDLPAFIGQVRTIEG